MFQDNSNTHTELKWNAFVCELYILLQNIQLLHRMQLAIAMKHDSTFVITWKKNCFSLQFLKQQQYKINPKFQFQLSILYTFFLFNKNNHSCSYVCVCILCCFFENFKDIFIFYCKITWYLFLCNSGVFLFH